MAAEVIATEKPELLPLVWGLGFSAFPEIRSLPATVRGMPSSLPVYPVNARPSPQAPSQTTAFGRARVLRDAFAQNILVA